ncbi:MAG: hypothetical protein AMXMBFR84_48520 [Candidatus Hydrogenedentota bacterium]
MKMTFVSAAVLGAMLTVSCSKSGSPAAVGLEQLHQEIRSAGYPATLEELNAWYAPVPDPENAAVDYIAAFELMEGTDPGGNKLESLVLRPDSLPRGVPFPEDWLAEVKGHLDQSAAPLEKIKVASAKSKSRYPIDLNKGFIVEFPHLGTARSAGRLVSLAAYQSAAAGDFDAYTEYHRQIFAVADSLAMEPTLISQLVWIAVRQVAFTNLQETMSRYAIPDTALVELRKIHRDTETKESYERAYVGERIFGASNIHAIYTGELDVEAHENLFVSESLKQSVMNAARASENQSLLEEEIAYLRAFDPILNAKSKSWPEILDAGGQVDLALRSENSLMAGSIADMITRSVAAFARDAAANRTAAIATSIEQFRNKRNRLPVDLLEMVPEYFQAVPKDPFDDKPLKYKRLPVGYVVYSVYMDKADEGGVDFDHSAEVVKGDFPFRVLR